MTAALTTLSQLLLADAAPSASWPVLLAQALTHKSAAPEHYEQLEFVGDRVLGLAVAHWLREAFPQADEGELSLRHTAMVRQAALLQVAAVWQVAALVRLGAGETAQPSVLADVVEALLGAVFVAAGWQAANALVRRAWGEMLHLPLLKDPKTRLQEWLQARGLGAPEYVLLRESGADHAKTFTLQAQAMGCTGIGTGPSKTTASALAAADLLSQLEGPADDQQH